MPRHNNGQLEEQHSAGVIPAPRAGVLLRQGFDIVGQALRLTLGPTGCTVLIEQMSRTDSPELLDDAATIARRIVELPLRHNTGAMLMRHLVWRVLDQVGDGTATAAVLAQALVREGARHIAAGAHPVGLRRGVETGLLQALEALDALRRPLQGLPMLHAVALAACHEEELADVVIGIYKQYGEEIIIALQESQASGLTVEVADGSKWDSGFASPSFVNDPERNLAWSRHCRLLLTNVELERAEQVIPVMSRTAMAGEQELVFIAPRISDAALSVMLTNNRLGGVHSLAITAPGLGDHRTGVLQDLAALTGARYINQASGAKIEDAQVEDLGRCDVVWASRDFFSVINGRGDATAIADRAQQVRGALERAETAAEREEFRLRLGRLTGGVAVLSVGAATKTEMLERKLRAERAVKATEAARTEGVVPGGGVALLLAAKAINSTDAGLSLNERLGRMALARAMEEPFRAIVGNVAGDASLAAHAVRAAGGTKVYDARLRSVADICDSGIFDASNVVRTALRDSVSIAVTALSVDTIIIPKDRIRVAPKNP